MMNISLPEIAIVATDIQKETGGILFTTNNYNTFIQQLTAHIQYLLDHHFEQLVFLLYRIDVLEEHIKQLLQLHATNNTATIIAEAIVLRQLQKIAYRKQFTNYGGKSNEEKW